jgi:hypothetical protein
VWRKTNTTFAVLQQNYWRNYKNGGKWECREVTPHKAFESSFATN